MTLLSPFDTQALVEAGARLSKPGDCLSNLIIDLTNCAWFDITTTEIFSMIAAKKRCYCSVQVKIALVVMTHEDDGLMRIFSSSTEYKRIRVFLGVAEAERWITMVGKKLSDRMSASEC